MPKTKSSVASGRRKASALRLHPAVPLPRSEKHEFEDVKSVDKVSRIREVHPSLLRASGALSMAFAGFTPLPNRLRAKLKYVSQGFALNSGVTPGVYVFSANGCYDPNITGTGHQPRGFDQLIALYDHYVVLSSRIRVEFGASTAINVVGIQLQATSTTQSDYIDYAEQPQCEFSLAPYILTSGGINEPRVHDMHFRASEFMGIPDPITSDKLQGSVSANPTDQAFYHVFSQNYDGSSTSGLGALASIEYDVVFIEPVPVASS
jgi:hypothetical protein